MHPWYQSKCPGGSLVQGISRRDQTALIRFLSGHLLSMTFVAMAFNTSKFEISVLLLRPSQCTFYLLGAYQAGLGSRSPIGFGLLQGEWTHEPDLALLISEMRNNIYLSMHLRRRPASFEQVSEFDRGRIVAFKEIDQCVGRNQATVMLFGWKRTRRGLSHPPRYTTARDDMRILCMAAMDR
ncbi:hypothetical protein TNCV_3772951 [Trichonephila clavipes]|nr:hypothetical protein TNCV_3772951 [Trichonephila clavipes]